MSSISTLSHTGTALVINEGQTIYVYDHGYFVRDDLKDSIVHHVEVEDSERAIAKSCEIFDDGKYVSVYGYGTYIPYASVVDGQIKGFSKPFDADTWIVNFITQHEATGECFLEEWEQFSDIYKDERGIRPRFGSYKFHII